MNDVLETNETTGSPDATAEEQILGDQPRTRRWRPIPVTLVLGVAVVTVYAAYERVGTTANAEYVEFTQNLAGGFLAIGMTDEQPGFMVLSELEQERVGLNATQVVNSVAGTHTVVNVQTPQVSKHLRLRGPQVLLISENGTVEQHNVDWSAAGFNSLRQAADCSHEDAIKKHRCGAPFVELQEALASWPRDRVPDRVRAFVRRYRDDRTHRHRSE